MANNEKAQKALDAMHEHINVMGFDEKVFAELMSKEHRTLQQCFTRVCIAWLAKLDDAHENNYCDLRNKASCELAHEILQKIDPKYLTLPFI